MTGVHPIYMNWCCDALEEVFQMQQDCQAKTLTMQFSRYFGEPYNERSITWLREAGPVIKAKKNRYLVYIKYLFLEHDAIILASQSISLNVFCVLNFLFPIWIIFCHWQHNHEDFLCLRVCFFSYAIGRVALGIILLSANLFVVLFFILFVHNLRLVA